MKGKKICFTAALASFLGAFIAALLLLSGALKTGQASGRIVLMGVFFAGVFLAGFLGMHLALRFSRRYQVQRPRRWLPVGLASCVLLFVVGAAGQALFMYSREEVTIPASVDMVLLLDASGSMDTSGYNKPRTDAGCQFVDSLGEDDRMQAVSFAGKVLDSSSLLHADAHGKTTLKEFIRGIDSVGTTDFNEPLREAMDTLTRQGRSDSGKAVILLTDGEGDLERSVVDLYRSSGVKVFTIRIDSSANMSAQARALADLANDTGGFDVGLTPASDGSVDPDAMLQAFQDAFQATSESRIQMRDDLLVCSEGISFYQFVIRALAFILSAILFGIGYFGQFSLKQLLLHGLTGLAAAVLVTVFGGAYPLCAAVFCLLMATAVVSLDMGEDEVYDV